VARSRKPSGDTVQVRVSGEFVDVRKDDERPELAAYAFGPGGTLLASAPLTGDAVDLSVPARAGGQALRVMVGPRVEEERALAELTRVGASEQFVRVGEEAELAVDFKLYRPDWLCWLRGLCTVRGTLLKRVTSGGVPIDLPVCGAEVEIFEVDPIPLIVHRIPDAIIDKLRQIVVKPFPPPPPPPDGRVGPFPIPPEPGPDLSPVRDLIALSQSILGTGLTLRQPSPTEAAGDFVTRSELSQLASERAPELTGQARAEAKVEEAEGAVRTIALAETAPEAPDEGEVAASLYALSQSSEVRIAASQGTAAFRRALIANAVLVRPLFCIVFQQVSTQLVTTAITDDCGHFRATFSQGCSSDTPDLYFVAYRSFGFFRVPIYRPLPIACHTWWDYACGDEITLYTTSPFAITCPPCRPIVADPYWVLVMGIGDFPLSRIYGTGSTLTATATNTGLTDYGAPFGGLCRLVAEFDNRIRDDLGVMYYRVSWKKAGSLSPYVPLDGDVHRHYSHVVSGDLVLEVYPLGPHVVGGEANLYEIPPALPPTGQWVQPSKPLDTTSALFPTATLVPPGQEGIYKLRLELFDGSGNAVDIGAVGIHYVVPTSTDLSGTVYTTNAAALGLVPPPPVDTGSAFVMRLHVDNNVCSAHIADPLLNGSVAANSCGVLDYAPGDTVELDYSASHPHGFATYAFTLVRGVTPLTPPSVPAWTPVGAGAFTNSLAVSYLLGGCPVAGYAESLYVAATAIDGWRRLDEYDRNDLRAFVLSPT
jgi:hypothetical protein